MLYHMWVRHHLRPGEFWSLPKGEQLLLKSFTLREVEAFNRPADQSNGMRNKGRRVRGG